VNRLDPFYWCIHDELLPRQSFLRNGKPHDVPARFQIWVRRTTRREPLIERKNHPDLIWVPKTRSAEATIWICRRGPDLGNIIEASGLTTPPEDYYGIRCSAEAVVILGSIRWRDVLDPLPSNHPPNMSQADIVRLYDEAMEMRSLGRLPDFEFLPRDRPDLREAADIVIRRIGVNAGKILNPTEVTRADTAHWLKVKSGVHVETVRARFRAIDWSDLKYVDAAEGYGARGYRSLSMSAVVDEYERCKTQTLTDIWHQPADKIADWMIAADPEKAGKVCMLLLERSSASSMAILYFSGHCIGSPA
jgi:hypothetical protein